MINHLKDKLIKFLKLIVTWLPWILAMYVFFWLDSSGIWTDDTPHRGKISVAILSSGMLISFIVNSYFTKKAKNTK